MKKKLLLLVIITASLALAYKFNLTSYLSLSYVQENLGRFKEFTANNPLMAMGPYFLVYVFVTAFSIPGATIMTLLGGALFGPIKGTFLVSFSSTLGATLAFILSRTLLRESVQKKFGDKIKSINDGIEREGPFYLLTLRLLPVFPFFLVNLVMGLTPVKVWQFFVFSQIGMLPGTIVYVYAGQELSELSSLSGIMGPGLLSAFALIGILPIISKKVVQMIKSKRAYKSFKRPDSFDYNMVAIGGGAAGLVTSYISAAVKAKVALIEKNKMGGDCLNTGCVPSKAIIRSAKVMKNIQMAPKLGLKSVNVDFDFKDVMDRVHRVISKIEPHDSIERYTSLGVECLTGKAKIISPWEIEINGKVITTKNITIATGASPFVPPIPGLSEINYLTSENLWQLQELPQKFIVLGAGPIGLEMAQSFARFGSDVTVIERGDQIMAKEDADVAEIVKLKMEKEGVSFAMGHEAVAFKPGILIAKKQSGETVEFNFDQVLIAIGRKANTKGFGLEALDLETRRDGTLKTNDFLQTTKFPNVYACGDVAGPYQLTHMASHQAWYCAVNGLFGRFKKFKADYSVVPWCTYSDPEVATVGLTEKAAKEAGKEYELISYGIDDLDRAIADEHDYGLVKVLVVPGKDKILGATIVGANASDMIIEFISAMKHGIGLNKILGTIHPYPTMSEANKYAAGIWKKKSAPEKLMPWAERFHKWERS